MSEPKPDIVLQLQQEILQMQGVKAPAANAVDMGLGPLVAAFPKKIFPTSTIHEFLSFSPQAAAATTGFMAGLLVRLMETESACIWVSTDRKIFPPGLKAFGIKPEQIIFVSGKSERELLWTTEEALKCEGLAAVVGEVPEINLTASRRLQLAVEGSGVTGFLLRHNPRNLNQIACAARWKILPLASTLEDSMSGVGHFRWAIELERVRNGQSGKWMMEWQAGRFHPIVPELHLLPEQLRRQTG